MTIREVTVVDDEEDPINVSITDMKGISGENKRS